MTSNPLVSVIIPTYNRANELVMAVKSVLDQHYQPVQLIVVDDGSTDDTKEKMIHFPQVEYILQEHSGQAAARNTGLERAKGSLIASLDSDDSWNPEFLSKCVAKLEKDGLDFVFANWSQNSPYGKHRDYLRTYPRLASFVEHKEDGWVDLTYKDLRAIYLDGCPSPSSSVLIKKSSIVQGWDSEMNIGDDWCLFLDLILIKKCKVAFSLEKLWTKNVNQGNIYDGRAWNEITELLYVKDLGRLLQKYESLLAAKETKMLEKVHIENMLGLAIFKLFKKGNVVQFYQLMKQSLQLGIARTLKIFPNTFFEFLNRRFKPMSNVVKQRVVMTRT